MLYALLPLVKTLALTGFRLRWRRLAYSQQRQIYNVREAWDAEVANSLADQRDCERRKFKTAATPYFVTCRSLISFLELWGFDPPQMFSV